MREIEVVETVETAELKLCLKQAMFKWSTEL